MRETLMFDATVRADAFVRPHPPIKREVGLAVVRNPRAGDVGDDLSSLFEIGARPGAQLMPGMVARLAGPAIAYGKAAIVGSTGALEHGAAMIHPRLGKPMRAAAGGGQALIPAHAKVAAPGKPIDIPLGHKDDPWSFDHIDTLTVFVVDAPRADEIVVCVAVPNGPRPHTRVGKGPTRN